MTVFRTRVKEIGAEAPELIQGGFLILFGDQAPPELRQVSVIHEPEPLRGPLEPGHLLVIGSLTYRITAVGDLANRNLETLGHLVIKFNGLSHAELPGDVCVTTGPAPQLAPGTVIRVEAR